MLLSRRNLMLSGSAVAALGGAGFRVGMLPEAGEGRRVLSAAEADLVAALGDALFPVGNPVGVAGREVNLPAEVDELLGDALDPEVERVFRTLLRVLDDGTWISRGRGFAALEPSQRQEVLETWADNAVVPRRMMHDVFRTVMGMAFFNQPAVMAAVGWRASCVEGRT